MIFPTKAMAAPIQLISTDFDGTLFAEFENPPIPAAVQELIGAQQAQGVKWVINTGRDLSSLQESLARAKLSITPDFLVLVEREIHVRRDNDFFACEEWNMACHQAHEEVFRRVRRDLPRLRSWVDYQFNAIVYEDAYSPFCLVAGNRADADHIHAYMNEYCLEIPDLQVVRNEVYARFAHRAYNKGRALAEIGRQLGLNSGSILAAGDHFNDLPMLHPEFARFLIAPGNAIDPVKQAVRNHGGFVSELPCGHGVAAGLRHWLAATANPLPPSD